MSKNEDIRNISIRQKNLLYLMHRYLIENGFFESANTLRAEARLTEDIEVCDNIDLDSIYLEFAAYYSLKFGKYPKFLKKSQATTSLPGRPTEGGRETSSRYRKSKSISTLSSVSRRTDKALNNLTGSADTTGSSDVNDNSADLHVTVTHINTSCSPVEEGEILSKPQIYDSLSHLKQVQHANHSLNNDILLSCQEWQSLTELVRSTIINEEVKLSWSDMCGNQMAIDIIKEAVLMPIHYPELFTSGLKPWRSALIHGPPGSGKTLLARILYAETRNFITFFNITSSVIVSKWRGESEKLLKILFYLAQKHAPSIIFFDEIESLTSRRDRITDHESSRRFKNELLQLMDGLEQLSTGIFVLASTNMPWEIDDAFLRRFEKKLLVQLPNEEERATLIRKLLPLCVKVCSEQIDDLVRCAEDFTGDEIRLACKEIAMQSVRQIAKISDKGSDYKLKANSLDWAFKQKKPLTLQLMEKHRQWQKQYTT